MPKFIQFNKTPNSNEFYNVDAIIKIEKWHSDDTDYEDRLTIYIADEEPFAIDSKHPHWTYLNSLLEELPD